MIALSDHIIVRPIKDNKTSSGLIIPDGANYRHPKGEVVAAGPGPINDPVTVCEGDIIMHFPGGVVFEHNGETLRSVNWKNVITKI